MTSPARDARLVAQDNGFTEIAGRGPGWIKMRKPSTNEYSLDGQLSNAGWHYGQNLDQEVDTAWEVDTGAWQYKMVLAGYNAYARNILNAGNTVQYVDPPSGKSVTFQPLALNWVNQYNSRQQLALPGSVAATVNDDKLYWANGYGTGKHFQWQAQTTRLQKLLIIDHLSDLPTAQPWLGSNVWLEIEFIFTPSSGLDILVDGVAWDKSGMVTTTNAIAFSNGESVLWYFQAPFAWDSTGNQTPGQMQLINQGNNYYVTVRVPKTWVDSAVFPIYLDPTVDKQVGASGDDFEDYEYISTFVSNDTANQVGHDGGGSTHFGVRFPSTTISGTINTSYIEGKASSSYTNTVPIRIYGVDADNPAAPTDHNGFTGLSLTTAYADWTPGNWNVDTWYQSASINSILQELVDTFTISNDAVMLIVKNNNAASGQQRRWRSYDQNTSNAPKLHVEYTESGTTVEESASSAKYAGITAVDKINANEIVAAIPDLRGLTIVNNTTIEEAICYE